MLRLRLSHALSFTAALLLTYACATTSAPKAPAAPRPEASFANGTPTALLGLSSGPVGFRSATDPALEAWAIRERSRVALAAGSSQRALDSLTLVRQSRTQPDASSSSRLLSCDPLPYAGSVRIVGPDGGELRVGPHSIRIPRGALTQYYVITAELPVSEAVTVRLSPHGLRFVQMPALTLSYSHCKRPENHSERVANTDEFLRVLQYPRSEDRKSTVVAWLEHFSRYAIAN